jgi:alanine racemase
MSYRAEAEISARALLNNYEVIRSQVPGQAILPMIKANAYGHGASWAAKMLAREPDLYGFGVATLEEGIEVRKALEEQKGRGNAKAKIVIASGATPFSKEKGELCEKYYLTPVLTREEDWALFLREGFHQRIPYELKFNTGMNRLGMAPGFAKQLAKTLKDLPTVEHPSGVLTHLAMGENPEEKLSQTQLTNFRAIHAELSKILPQTYFHLANSGAIWNSKQWGLDGLTDIVRPGLSLYGVPPWQGAPARGLQPVMTLRAPVIARHQLKPGDRIGYGGTVQVAGTAAPGKDAAGVSDQVAVLAIGYADGMKRGLGGLGAERHGQVFLNGKYEPVIGIVSMDLCAISCSPKTKVGDWAEILGPNMDPWVQSRSADTIPYELLTGISSRVDRRWV